MMIEERIFNVVVRFFREEGFPGWTAHVLNLDAVTHGESLPHAIDMAIEAAGQLIVDDLNAGRNPDERRAPAEEWAVAFSSIGGGSPVPLPEVIRRESEFKAVVVGLPVAVARIKADGSEEHQPLHGHGAEGETYRVFERVA